MLHIARFFQGRAILFATLTVPMAFVAYAASASPILSVQYEVYNDQQAAPRDRQPASDLQTVANQQTPSELQSHGAQQRASQDQPASSEQKGEQASAPPSAPEQPNAFVSGKSNEPQDVAQGDAQSKQSSDEQPGPPPEQKSPDRKSEPPQTRQAPPATETKSGEDNDP